MLMFNPYDTYMLMFNSYDTLTATLTCLCFKLYATHIELEWCVYQSLTGPISCSCLLTAEVSS